MRRFDEINKKLAFGCMRLPTKDGAVDYDEFSKMIDYFIANGFNYFDTARPYHMGQSEIAVGKCLSARYPREKFLLADKLSAHLIKGEQDILPMFNDQLAKCGVEYFDFYLLHALSKARFDFLNGINTFAICAELKRQGKIRHLGISFHDSAEVLEYILTTRPEIEFVQLQLNYVDMDDEEVQAQKCYDVCVKHNKPVMVMEPVKGGRLATLTEPARKVFDELNGGSPASYAIRYCASKDNVEIVLSGMSNFAQLKDNVDVMKNFAPLSQQEQNAVEQVRQIIKSTPLLGCTGCKYCVEGCPKHINIPECFYCLDTHRLFGGTQPKAQYNRLIAKYGKASDCIKCGKCEQICPQKLHVRDLLAQVAKEFEL